ncbi:hypothetical protein LTR16_004609 [Cryomyces antarcticus]|uniref:Uncharacterized protein n=1 Tax=Cryomyces antarcticus TaxID=329879 RepID=A0ABR0M6E9_9PEZI|nr:hypothetical protein LTR39_003181 [Cryomyces antarcticus]KAK5285408.1 hypothetical protein LTR16_004609 [Cryomyces antarcticus]
MEQHQHGDDEGQSESVHEAALSSIESSAPVGSAWSFTFTDDSSAVRDNKRRPHFLPQPPFHCDRDELSALPASSAVHQLHLAMFGLFDFGGLVHGVSPSITLPDLTSDIPPVSILLVNAITILSEDRFLARIGWGNTPSDPGFGGVPDSQSIKAKMVNLIASVRTLMRSINTAVIIYELLLG